MRGKRPGGAGAGAWGAECMVEMRRSGRWLLVVFAAWLLGGSLQGCREEEQDRVFLQEKGVYQGPEDPPLAAEQVDELRYRARTQAF